jgi:hypothetical protein
MEELRFFAIRLARFVAGMLGLAGGILFPILAVGAVIRGSGGPDGTFMGDHWIIAALGSVVMFFVCAAVAITARTKYAYATEPPSLAPKVCTACRREVNGRRLRCPLCGSFNADGALGYVGLGLNFLLTCLNGLVDLLGIAFGLLTILNERARAEKRRREDLAREIARQMRR